MKLVRKRKNGTLRSLPYLALGTTPRKDAEAVVARRAQGETISAIADDLKTSIATVRRMETTLYWLKRSKPASTRTSGP